MKFGKNVEKGAKKLEELKVKDLVFEHDTAAIQKAWQMALSDIKKIIDFCADNDIDLIILIFPYTFQFDLPDSMAYPQEIMKDFCERYRVPYIDFLPVFSREIKSSGRGVDHYFMDFDHPTSEGSKVISESIFDYLKKSGPATLFLDNKRAG